MTVRDRKILDSQADQVMRLILERGFNPIDFKLETTSSNFPWPGRQGVAISRVLHIPTKSYFDFDWDPRQRQSYYTPGSDTRIAHHPEVAWISQLNVTVGQWLQNLRREMETPNLWARVSEAGISTLSMEDPDSFFTEGEVEQLRVRLDVLEANLIGEHALREADAETVRVELGQLKDQLGRLNKRLWGNLFIGTLFKLAFTIEPLRDAVGEIIGKALELIGGFFTGHTPMLPPPT